MTKIPAEKQCNDDEKVGTPVKNEQQVNVVNEPETSQKSEVNDESSSIGTADPGEGIPAS